jgi:hypothetical protein
VIIRPIQCFIETYQPAQKRDSILLMSRFEHSVIHHYWIIIVILLLINMGLAVTSSIDTSLTYDEPTYIGVGQYMLKTGDTGDLLQPSSPSFY